MPHSGNSHLNDELVRRMAVSACFAEIALAAGGEWNPSRLEEKIHNRSCGDLTNCYWRMTRGIVPNNRTVDRLENLLEQSCQLLRWRDHPFWKLLMLQPLRHQDISAALLSIRSNIKRYLWVNPPDDGLTEGRAPRYEASKEFVDQIAMHRTFDALVALTALAREARDRGTIRPYYMCSLKSFEIFPHVVTKHPQLYISWKSLAMRLDKVIWNPKAASSYDPRPPIKRSNLSKQIKTLADAAVAKGIPLPPQETLRRHSRKIR